MSGDLYPPPTISANPRLSLAAYNWTMTVVSAIASTGMMNAAARLQTSAAKVADPNSGADLSTEAVNQITARLNFSANALMLRADAKMTGTLLDMLT